MTQNMAQNMAQNMDQNTSQNTDQNNFVGSEQFWLRVLTPTIFCRNSTHSLILNYDPNFMNLYSSADAVWKILLLVFIYFHTMRGQKFCSRARSSRKKHTVRLLLIWLFCSFYVVMCLRFYHNCVFNNHMCNYLNN